MRLGEAWDRRYNVSGVVAFGARLKNGDTEHFVTVDDWCNVLRCVLETDQVDMIGHFTGAISVSAVGRVTSVVSSGFEEHDFWAMVSGDRAHWIDFATSLQSRLLAAQIQHSVSVHRTVEVLP